MGKKQGEYRCLGGWMTKLISIKEVGIDKGFKKIVCVRQDEQTDQKYTIEALKEPEGPNWQMSGAPIEIMEECIGDIENKWKRDIFGG